MDDKLLLPEVPSTPIARGLPSARTSIPKIQTREELNAKNKEKASQYFNDCAQIYLIEQHPNDTKWINKVKRMTKQERKDNVNTYLSIANEIEATKAKKNITNCIKLMLSTGGKKKNKTKKKRRHNKSKKSKK